MPERAHHALPFLRCRDAAAAFPLFDLPDEAVELVLGLVDHRVDKRALHLVCKRTRASVDSRVVAVVDTRWHPGEQQLSARPGALATAAAVPVLRKAGPRGCGGPGSSALALTSEATAKQ